MWAWVQSLQAKKLGRPPRLSHAQGPPKAPSDTPPSSTPHQVLGGLPGPPRRHPINSGAPVLDWYMVGRPSPEHRAHDPAEHSISISISTTYPPASNSSTAHNFHHDDNELLPPLPLRARYPFLPSSRRQLLPTCSIIAIRPDSPPMVDRRASSG